MKQTACVFIKMMYRIKLRIALYIMGLIAGTIFFVVSFNLYYCSVNNLQQVDRVYSTVATVEFYGDVDRFGRLANPDSSEYIGYWSVAVRNYDLTQITDVDCIKAHDLRAQYGVYILDEVAMTGGQGVMEGIDIIRFELLGDEPITIYGSPKEPQRISLRVIESAAGYEYGTQFVVTSDGLHSAAKKYYAEQLRHLNGGDITDCLILYPGVEYLMVNQNNNVTHDPITGAYHCDDTSFAPVFDLYQPRGYRVYYHTDGTGYRASDGVDGTQPFYLQFWDEVKNDPVLNGYFAGAMEQIKYNCCSYNAMLTNDMSGIPAFQLGAAELLDGRAITPEEYSAGAKVCVVSSKLADAQGWAIGDKLNMYFYEHDLFAYNIDHEINILDTQPFMDANTNGFCSQGEYEIVGIYKQSTVSGCSDISESTIALSWTTIFVPKKSVENRLPETELPIHGSLLTLWLKNGSIGDFLAEMETRGVIQPREGEYQVSFVFDDQGYSLIQPGLQSMHSTAQLLLTLSVLLLITTVVLLAYFFAQGQKHNVGILRMLGGSKARALLSMLLCAAIIAVLGCGTGTVLGHVFSQKIGGEILTDSLSANTRDNDFNAFLLDTAATHEIELLAGANVHVSLAAGLTGLGTFLLLLLAFVLLYIPKEPRTLLPKSKA